MCFDHTDLDVNMLHVGPSILTYNIDASFVTCDLADRKLFRHFDVDVSIDIPI